VSNLWTVGTGGTLFILGRVWCTFQRDADAAADDVMVCLGRCTVL